MLSSEAKYQIICSSLTVWLLSLFLFSWRSHGIFQPNRQTITPKWNSGTVEWDLKFTTFSQQEVRNERNRWGIIFPEPFVFTNWESTFNSNNCYNELTRIIIKRQPAIKPKFHFCRRILEEDYGADRVATLSIELTPNTTNTTN